MKEPTTMKPATTKQADALLDSASLAAAEHRADALGLSVSAYVRDLIRADGARSCETARDITPLIGILGNGSSPTSVARDKHQMISEAFSEDLDRKQHSRAVIK